MRLAITSHVMRRFLERTIEAKVKEAYLVPPRTIVRLGIVDLPLKRIKEERRLYAYHPDWNGLFFLQAEDEKIVVKTFIILHPLLGDCLRELIQNGNLKRVDDAFSLL